VAERAGPFTHLPEVAFGSRDVLATTRENLSGEFRVTTN
jgi:hypothetical protein